MHLECIAKTFTSDQKLKLNSNNLPTTKKFAKNNEMEFTYLI